ncbi:MAG: DDE-type integrase/transposase/recombinase [Rubrivivax sp.]|nr:DDE-type integrase/transposase/recombinase [Rubrivivax sp.]
MHPDGQPRRTWAFVMTLRHSRHHCVEFDWDQNSADWLGRDRRAFEWFAGVPRRVIIDNAKCAITRACAHVPTVQRAYAEAAEGYGFKIDPCPPHDPQKNGKAERFSQSALGEWAYGWTHQNSNQRTLALANWQYHYNLHRPHAGIGGAFPMSRLIKSRNNLLTVHR